MTRTVCKQIYAGLLLALLLSMHIGRGVHIYSEDLRSFAGFNRDLMPDDGTLDSLSDHCIVCNYFFFPYLQEEESGHLFYEEVLAVLQPEATSCKCVVAERLIPLRAPPRV